jgi:hypothetical protein
MAKKSPGPRYRLTCYTISDGNRDTVVAYYLTAKQRAVAWDGVSPLKMPFAKITANALNDTARRGHRPAAVKLMKLSTVWLDDRWYYFWMAEVCHEGDSNRAVTTEVVLDLRGEVVERQETVFEDTSWKKRSAASRAFAEALPAVL